MQWSLSVSPVCANGQEKYREIHKNNGTLTPEVEAHFDGMEITINALLETLQRLIAYAKKHHPENQRIREEIIALVCKE